jgi:polar amino acid transport system substrate-binding protein
MQNNKFKLKLNFQVFISFMLIALFFSSNLISAEKKKLRWAADAESGAPYVFQDPKVPTKLIGFEVDIIKALAKEMDMEDEFVQNQWDGLIPGIKSRNDYDIAINGLEITKDRQKEVEFSIPYYITYEQLVVKISNNSVYNLNDLNGKKAGTLKNSVAERILKEIPTIETLNYDSEVNSYEDLANEKVDAVLLDAPIAKYYASWNPQLKLVGSPVGEITYGIAINKDNKELASQVNAALSRLIYTGKLREILESWDLWNYQMANMLNDTSKSKIKPTNYESFILNHKRELTWEDYVKRYLSYIPIFAKAALTTVEITVVSMVLAIIFGLFLALIRVYAPKPFSNLAIFYIEVTRGTPLLIQLFFIYYALPTIGIIIKPYVAAVVGLGLNYAAYEAENYRAGLFAVPRGQMEAAISLGMSRNQALRHIIVPQAVRLVIPPITNDFISLLKDSSLVSVITMVELTKVYQQLSSTYYDFIGTGIMVAMIYLLLGLPFVKLSKIAEQYFALDKRRSNNHI